MRIVTLALTLLTISCTQLKPIKEGTQPVSHHLFDELLQKYVEADGMVNYQGFASEREKLDQYLKLLAEHPPNDQSWTRNDQIAYWINVYNAFTIDLVLDNYPLESIKDIGASIQLPFVNTPWDIDFIEINEEIYDLNNIEHNILRKNWDEPRIHFAINCASISCPKLRSEAYVGSILDQQLKEQAIDFLNDPSKNKVSKEGIQVSKIFKWFSSDFEKQMDLFEYLNQYSKHKIVSTDKIEYMDYNWQLNESKN